MVRLMQGRRGAAVRLRPLLGLPPLLALPLAAPAQTPEGYGDLTATPPATATPAGPDLEAYGRIQGVSPGDLIDTATRQVDVFQQRLARILDAVPDTGDAIIEALQLAAPDFEPSFFLGVFVFMVILIIIGRGGAAIFAAYVARPIMIAVQKPRPEGIVEKLPVLATRLGLTFVAVAIAMVVAGGIGAFFFDQHPPTLRTAVVIMATYAAIMLLDTTWRMAISPFLPNYRIPSIPDDDAILLYRYVSAATTVGVIAIGLGIWLELMEVRAEVVALLKVVLGTLTTLMLMVMAVRTRRIITSAILGGQPRKEAAWLPAIGSWLWLPVLLGYLLFSWGASSFRLILGLPAPAGLSSAYAVLLASMIVYVVTVYVLERVFARVRLARELNRRADAQAAAEKEVQLSGTKDVLLAAYEGESGDLDGDGGEEGSGGGVIMPPRPAQPPPREEDAVPPPPPPPPPARASMRTFEDLARRGAALLALGFGAFTMLRIWVGPVIFEEGSIWNLAQDVVDTALIGYLVYHGIRIWIDRRIEEEGGADIVLVPGDEGLGSATTRLGTLLPLIRTAVLGIVAIAVGLLIAMRLGVNVAPLFAGAGIVGLAIGFGSQTLVRDILSGMFFLLDDAFRKGEYIDVGDVKGTVEKISIRSFQLRHHLGALNTIPFGEIKHLTNFSRDWVMMKLPLRLTYDTDVDKVRKVVKKLGEELLKHPVEGPKFLQPLKSQGVYMMEDSAMIVRVKYMTRPGDQWTTRKLVYERIRELFAKEGIKFAHREVTVRIPDLDRRTELTEEQVHAVGAAARRAVDLADEAALMPKAALDAR
jgi:small-conductance mechanosensitive channel